MTTIRNMYLSAYRYINDNYAAADAGRGCRMPFSFLRTANGTCFAIQAITLPRSAIKKGCQMHQYDPKIIKLIASNPWAARNIPDARRNHKARMHGLAKINDATILAIADEICRVRGQRSYTDYRSPPEWEMGCLSDATRRIDLMQREIQRQWVNGQALTITPSIRAGIATYTQARLSRAVGGGLVSHA